MSMSTDDWVTICICLYSTEWLFVYVCIHLGTYSQSDASQESEVVKVLSWRIKQPTARDNNGIHFYNL